METLKKTIYIPSSHRLQFDLTLPDNFPTGDIEVVLIFAPKTSSPTSSNSQKFLNLAGQLQESAHFKGDPLTLQKGLRDEWQG